MMVSYQTWEVELVIHKNLEEHIAWVQKAGHWDWAVISDVESHDWEQQETAYQQVYLMFH